MKTIGFVFILVIALVGLTAGCVLIPTPHYYAIGSRQNVTEQSTNLIQPGTDTIETVILKLGEPDAISPDERKMTFSSEKIIGLIIAPVDTRHDVSQYRFLDVMLDNHGVVTNREVSRVGSYLNQVCTNPRAQESIQSTTNATEPKNEIR